LGDGGSIREHHVGGGVGVDVFQSILGQGRVPNIIALKRFIAELRSILTA